MKRWILGLAVVVVLVGLGRTHAAVYSVTDLGNFGGEVPGCTIAINDLGQVAGGNYLYSGGTVQSLGTWNGATQYVQAAGINNGGQIIGNVAQVVALLRNSNGPWQPVGGMGGGSLSIANGINNLGYIVGSFGGNGFVYYGSGSALNMGSDVNPVAINDHNQIVGSYIEDADGLNNTHAFLYVGGNLQDLGTLVTGMYNESWATAINNNGQVVGNSFNASTGYNHAFLYTSGSMHDLGTLLGCLWSEANDINDNGQIVGMSASGGDRAVLFTINGPVQDLNSLIDPSSGWTLSDALAINNNGQIVGKCSITP